MRKKFLILLLAISPTSLLANVDQYDSDIEKEIESQGVCISNGKTEDIGTFCPNGSDDKLCMKSILKAIIQLESGGDPGKVFDESNYEKGMKDSVGLFQLSKGECVPEGDNLTNPKANIACGIRTFCKLVNKSGKIAGADREGAAEYWSVLRNPYNLSGKKGGIISVGKRKEVIKLTQQFMSKQ